jgi:pyruvate/2-oxoglutarate dehydrogenase complex dihydrolipoamide acyltransferase (E2) component
MLSLMRFAHQLIFPPLDGSPVTACLERWRRKPSDLVECGDIIADLSVDGAAHFLRLDFPCMLSSLPLQPGATLKTGDWVGACAAEGEDLPYNRESLLIQKA